VTILSLKRKALRAKLMIISEAANVWTILNRSD